MKTLVFAAVALCLGTVPAQVVDYPDSAIGDRVSSYPINTPSDGGVVRGQILCPATFAGLPKTTAIVSRVGIQLAGRAEYETFVLRAGTTKLTDLTTSWTANLPDQRIQKDLSGTTIEGGVTPTPPDNVWVEFELDHPFLYQPGSSIVVDITARSRLAAVFCHTAIGQNVARAYDEHYTSSSGGPTKLENAGGLKLRFVFQPVQWVSYGDGCPGAGGFTPFLSMNGSMKPGTDLYVNVTSCRGGVPTFFFLGLSSLRAPLPIGGDCMLLTPLDWITAMISKGSGAGDGGASQLLRIPNDMALLGQVVNTQWAQLDSMSAALIPFSLSNGGKILIN